MIRLYPRSLQCHFLWWVSERGKVQRSHGWWNQAEKARMCHVQDSRSVPAKISQTRTHALSHCKDMVKFITVMQCFTYKHIRTISDTV